MRKIFSILILVTLSLGLLTARAAANSAPPPSVMWFYFDLPGGSTGPGGSPFDGLQLLGCDNPACSEPVLMQQVGRCDLPGCLAGPPLATADAPADWSKLECFGNRCRSQSYRYPRPYFRLALQTAGGGVLLFSGVEKLPESYAETRNWRVTAQEGGLSLAPTGEIETPTVFSRSLWSGYLLTLAVELLLAGLIWGWRLRQRLSLPRLLLFAGLATSLTYPVVYFSPALASFARAGERTLFNTALFSSLFLGGLAWLLLAAVLWPPEVGRLRASPGWRWAIGLATGASMLACILLCPMFAFGVLYGSNYQLAAAGIPALLAIGLAEAYAFGFEALCYRLWSRGALDWRMALLLSLLANLASLGLGFIL